MNNWWFTADNHFGHANIIGYSQRGFNNVDEMDEVMIREWNNHVRKRDTIVICGDFCLERGKGFAERYVSLLNGNKIFVKGNHDHWIRKDKRYAYNKVIGGIHIYVSHYPYRTWPRSFANGWNLHGHTHGNLKPIFYNQLDVGVDMVFKYRGAYRPISFSEVNDIILEQNKVWLSNNELPPRGRNGEKAHDHC